MPFSFFLYIVLYSETKERTITCSVEKKKPENSLLTITFLFKKKMTER